MKLFLTSIGLPKETRKYFLKLLEKDPETAKIVFIPTAADPEEDKWFVDSAKKELKDIGLRFSEIDLKSESQISLKKKLSGADVVYVNGGNTFYLLEWVRRSGFDNVVMDFLKKGGIYLGVSAGSILTGPRIDCSNWDERWDKNIVGIKDTGLCLVDFATVPHYTEDDFGLLSEKSKSVSYSVVGLADYQAILVNGKEIRTVGQGKPMYFSKKRMETF